MRRNEPWKAPRVGQWLEPSARLTGQWALDAGKHRGCGGAGVGEANRDQEFVLADARVWPALLEIERGGERSRVEPRMMEVLVYLAQHAPQPVSRDALMEAVWPDRPVSEDSLNRIISRLRAVFDDDPRSPRLIETIPRRGYRLLQTPQQTEPETLSADAPAEGPAQASTYAAFDTSERIADLMASAPVPAQTATAVPPRPVFGYRSLWWMGAVVLLAAAGTVRDWSRPDAAEPPPAPRFGVLTAYPGKETSVAFDRTGQRAVFTWDGEAPGNRDLYLRDVIGGLPQRLTRDPADDHAAVFAPDGEHLAFVRSDAQAQCSVRWLNLSTGEERELVTCHPMAHTRLAVTPDGGRVIFNDTPGLTSGRLVEVRLDNPVRRDLTSPPPGAHDHFPAVSHDGRWVAFTRLGDLGGQDIFRMPAEGGVPERLTYQDAAIFNLAWTPRGDILYVSDKNGGQGFWRVRPGKVPQWLGLSESDVQFPALSGDGHLLSFERVQLQSGLWHSRLSTDRSGGRAVMPSSRQDWFPRYSADGRQLVFSSNRSGQFGVWLVDADGGVPRALREGLGLSPVAPSFAPDGTRVIYSERQQHNADICVITVTDGSRHCPVSDPANDVHPLFTPDGKSIVFASNRAGTYHLYRAAADGSAVTRISDTPAVAPLPLADGRLLFMRFGRPGLWVREIEGAERELHPGLPALSFRNFDSDGVDAWFIDQRGHLLRIPLPGGEAVDLGELAGAGERSGFTLCPVSDGYAYARIERDEIDLALVQGLFDAGDWR
ncbi:winged helix-turn-helix domain-containing protein [Tahibacter amnicola]|uniref:Winged helix-turn-helix domain-containing protein n=1 Tax=Tahibacter amnicola TaxID=2976241 RepID=A0ABY6BFJ1_9GAMM|nr:winged helix-turn-helix domain-containing protein [Tahibacter amnicola]UXI68794.1 winged helix-turn-helix domain-containing protein [Tahibacter amnicola]